MPCPAKNRLKRERAHQGSKWTISNLLVERFRKSRWSCLPATSDHSQRDNTRLLCVDNDIRPPALYDQLWPIGLLSSFPHCCTSSESHRQNNSSLQYSCWLTSNLATLLGYVTQSFRVRRLEQTVVTNFEHADILPTLSLVEQLRLAGTSTFLKFTSEEQHLWVMLIY